MRFDIKIYFPIRFAVNQNSFVYTYETLRFLLTLKNHVLSNTFSIDIDKTIRISNKYSISLARSGKDMDVTGRISYLGKDLSLNLPFDGGILFHKWITAKESRSGDSFGSLKHVVFPLKSAQCCEVEYFAHVVFGFSFVLFNAAQCFCHVFRFEVHGTLQPTSVHLDAQMPALQVKIPQQLYFMWNIKQTDEWLDRVQKRVMQLDSAGMDGSDKSPRQSLHLPLMSTVMELSSAAKPQSYLRVKQVWHQKPNTSKRLRNRKTKQRVDIAADVHLNIFCQEQKYVHSCLWITNML